MKNQHKETKDTIQRHDGNVYIRFGFGWKGAEWKKTTKENLMRVVDGGHYAHYDVVSFQDGIGIAFYTAADMM